MKKVYGKLFSYIYLVVFSLILVLLLTFTLTFTKTVKNKYYDIQIASSNLTKEAFDAIKDRKSELGISINKYDKFNSGLIGNISSDITTTMGTLEAKLTALNPNFAAVYIKMFQDAGLKAGDEIALVFSGSFPTLNIACLAAVETYGLKPVVMASIGSSGYGANDPDFTFFDMINYLNEKNIIKSKIDYISFGGNYDTGKEFDEEIRNKILNRINASDSKLINIEDYNENIKTRTKYIYEKCPNVKLMVSVGGSLVAMGKSSSATIDYYGLIKPNYLNTLKKDKKNIGLLDTFLSKGVPVVQMLYVKGICLDYDIPYEPDVIPEVGNGAMYYQVSYNIIFIILMIILIVATFTLYIIFRIKKKEFLK